MTYVKPAIAELGKASAAIQGVGNKTIQRAPDAEPHQSMLSTGASYDLDE